VAASSTAATPGWTREATPSKLNLNAVVDAGGIEVVGGAGGTVLER